VSLCWCSRCVEPIDSDDDPECVVETPAGDVYMCEPCREIAEDERRIYDDADARNDEAWLEERA
jgi:hypothetical protein